ncbi:hypothetical protein APR08_000409 [Nocardia amikacinitolerans]|nr:hypothetical protein [Nocardia amikacinitolerans]
MRCGISEADARGSPVQGWFGMSDSELLVTALSGLVGLLPEPGRSHRTAAPSDRQCHRRRTGAPDRRRRSRRLCAALSPHPPARLPPGARDRAGPRLRRGDLSRRLPSSVVQCSRFRRTPRLGDHLVADARAPEGGGPCSSRTRRVRPRPNLGRRRLRTTGRPRRRRGTAPPRIPLCANGTGCSDAPATRVGPPRLLPRPHLPQVAEHLGVGLPAVKSRIRSGLAQLALALSAAV